MVSGAFSNVESTNISTSPADQSLNQSKHKVGGWVSENKIESKPEAFILNKDNSLLNVLSYNFSCGVFNYSDTVAATSDTVLNVSKMSDKSLNSLVDNLNVCDKNVEIPLASHPSINIAPSLASQPDNIACFCETSKGVCRENKSDKCNTSSNNNNQICFNCGTKGHIARNCLNRIFVSHNLPRGENEFRGRSLNRNSSRSRSRNDYWVDKRNRKRDIFHSHKRFFNHLVLNRLPKGSIATQRSSSSQSNSGSSTNSGRSNTCFKQIVKHKMTKLTEFFKKPNYKWRPKPAPNTSFVSSEKFKCNKSEKASGSPRKIMTWVPKSN